MPDFSLEQAAGGVVCGIDEAGRGPWAGPVVAAAVVLDTARLSGSLRDTIDDSKKLTRVKRETLFAKLQSCAQIGVGQAGIDEIDSINILEATLQAMARAVDGLGVRFDRALVDGNRTPRLPCPVQCVVRGDGKSLSIAAASIVAKVTRDRIMAGLATRYPGYGWERNAGYGTAEHRAALVRFGVTPEHRRSFKPIRKMLSQD